MVLDPQKEAHGAPNPEWRFCYLWNRIVAAYMKCGLTKADDKLIALSGIASNMQQVLKDDYLDGLWRRFLPYELLWFVNNRKQTDGSPSFRPNIYRAPSW